MTDSERLRLERRVLSAVESLTDAGWLATTRAVRFRVVARATNVDEALRALLSKRQVKRLDDGWVPTRRGRTRLGHAPGRRHGAGGAQVALGRAMSRVSAGIVAEFDMDPSLADRLAREWLVEALPERQRARLLNNAT